MSAALALRTLPAEQLGFGWPEEIRPVRTEKDRPPAATMDSNDLTEALHGALRRAFDGADSPVKRIARAANSNERAAKDWWQGKNLPSAVHLLRLMATVPEFAGEVRRLTGMYADLDPEFERDFHMAMLTFGKLLDRKRGGER